MKYFTVILLLNMFFIKTVPPPGTVYLNDNLFIDKSTISVLSWKEYVMVNEKNNEFAYYPDTSYIVNGLNYYTSSYYNSKPIVKISFEAMQSYIDWRTDFINNNLVNFSKTSTCRDKFYIKNFKKNVKISYRLANKEEYLKAIEKEIIMKVDKSECFTKEQWSDSSTFRCVASFIKLPN